MKSSLSLLLALVAIPLASALAEEPEFWNWPIVPEIKLPLDANGKHSTISNDAMRQILAKNDGMPALGWVTGLHRDGAKLLADLNHIPKKIYELIKRRGYDRVSAEVYWNYKNPQEPGSMPSPRLKRSSGMKLSE